MEQLPLTAFLNKYFAGLALAVLHALHITPEHPKTPITNTVAMELLVFAILILFFVLMRSRLSVENPRGLQHVMEGLHGFIQGQSDEIIGQHSEPYTPFLVSLFLFILLCNLMGLIPGFESPTADPSVPLGCAVISFVYYNLMGIRKQGPLHYALHFTGPVWWLAWLMLPIEIISHLARMLSLTIRLFANMFAGDMVTLVFFSLVPLGVPVLFLGLHLGVSFLQAYIFTLLVTVYLAGAVETAH
ncbi:MAG: F0F1 ATP synthase subunit A [Acidobacteriaceae bacterium]|nr:F0F1 ATP synthase subunit A [Acidobacteriaceae bacterium]